MWEHAAAQQGRNLVGIDLVVFGLPAMNGFHRQGMPQDKGNLFVSVQVGEPVPGEDTFDSDHQAVPGGRDGFEKGGWRRLHIAVHKHLPVLAEDTDGQAAGVQIDTAVTLMLGVVTSPEDSSFLGNLFFPLPAYHGGM